MARPIREQFLVATLLLLIPVGAVMTWAGLPTYSDQLNQLQAEAVAIAAAVAAHIDQTTPEGEARLGEYIRAIPLPDGSRIAIKRADGTLIASHPPNGSFLELSSVTRRTVKHGWDVSVGLPTTIAHSRSTKVVSAIVLISGIATLVLLGMQMIILRRWLPALKSLEQTADRVGRGDLRPLERKRMPSRELEHVRDAFADMIEKLREAREAIARQMEEERQIRGEVESLQRQVIRQERLAAIGVLLSGIAHELNNPLQAISGSAEILQREGDATPAMRADLALIHKESARASNIIRNLSRFSRQQGTRPSPVAARDLIASVVELRHRRLGDQQITLIVEDEATGRMMGVLTELQQVLLNFVVNAEQAIVSHRPAERRIVIRSFDAGPTVHIEVEDTGPGVPPEDESKLFQPFFTTKPVGDGTGLGLSVSYGIIRSAGGTIGYRRGPAGGAVFHFSLPVVAPAAATGT